MRTRIGGYISHLSRNRNQSYTSLAGKRIPEARPRTSSFGIDRSTYSRAGALDGCDAGFLIVRLAIACFISLAHFQAQLYLLVHFNRS